jgi:hypothetical protein
MEADRFVRLADAIHDRLFYFTHPPQDQEEVQEHQEAYATIEELTSAPIPLPGEDARVWTHKVKLAAYRLIRRGEGTPITDENEADMKFLLEAQNHLRALTNGSATFVIRQGRRPTSADGPPPSIDVLRRHLRSDQQKRLELLSSQGR